MNLSMGSITVALFDVSFSLCSGSALSLKFSFDFLLLTGI